VQAVEEELATVAVEVERVDFVMGI